VKKILRFLIDSLFPRECLLCEKETEAYLCSSCFKSLKFKEQACLNCQTKTNLGEFCLSCQKKFSYQGVMVAASLKDPKIEKLITLFKYNFIKEIGYYLGLFLFKFFKEKNENNPILKNNSESSRFNPKNSIIIPVPLSRKRMKWRGFNQSEILAKIISEKTQIKISNNLCKIKESENQAKLKLLERKENLKNCFSFINKNIAQKEIKGKKIIIIDDISTSGSTLEEISSLLKKYQALEIWGLVVAHG